MNQTCENCGSERVLQISGKCNDMCNMSFKNAEHNCYVPSDSPVGGGDYIEIDICFACGKAQGIMNIEDPEFYEERKDDEDEDD